MEHIKKKITNKQKPQLNRFRRPEFEALMLHDDSRVQQEEEKTLPLLSWQEPMTDCHNSTNEKIMDSSFPNNPLNFIFLL